MARWVSVTAALGIAAASVRADVINVPGDHGTIQAAIDAALDGDEIVVAPGTYPETIDLLGKAITVRSSGGPEVTLIDGQDAGRVVTASSGEGADTVLEGFTITGGLTPLDGGGMLIANAGPTVIDCTFLGNSAGSLGGGLRAFGGDLTLTRCRFVGNTADRSGAVRFDDGSMTLSECIIAANSASAIGGVGAFSADVMVKGCIFTGNAGTSVGGLVAAFGTLHVVDCAFIGNNASFAGAGLGDGPNDFTLVVNCLFVGNSSSIGAGLLSATNDLTVVNSTFVENINDGLYFDGNVSPAVANCIFWGNGEQISGPGPSPQVTFSDVQGGVSGVGNIDVDPMFTSGTTGTWTADAIIDGASVRSTFTDSTASFGPGALVGEVIMPFTLAGPSFRTVVIENTATTITVYGAWPFVFEGAEYRIEHYDLDAGSSCIDAADNAAVPEGINTDLDGNPRFLDVPETADTGNGDLPVVDMGAYESLGGGCLAVTAQEVVCHDDGTTLTVNVEGLNACTGSAAQVTFTGSGGAHGEDFCFVTVINDDQGGFCCSTRICVTIPDCSGAACPCDLDGNDVVGTADLLTLLAAWATEPAGAPDLDGDGQVGTSDLLELLANWGPC